MALFEVKPAAQLLWPVELYESMRPDHRGVYGWREDMKRKRHLRVRGEEGYVVDLDAPFEAEWCKGQGKILIPLAKKRGRPKSASKIDFQPALDKIAEWEAEHGVPGEPSTADDVTVSVVAPEEPPVPGDPEPVPRDVTDNPEG